MNFLQYGKVDYDNSHEAAKTSYFVRALLGHVTIYKYLKRRVSSRKPEAALENMVLLWFLAMFPSKRLKLRSGTTSRVHVLL